jgi:molybdate transport system ATP-binding protein
MLDRRTGEYTGPNSPVSTGALDVRLRQDTPVPLDATLSCPPNELLALIGPSGSGKSTILQIIAGLRPCREGTIRVGSETWLDTATRTFVSPQQRCVGLVFQDYALFPHLTAEDNVAIALGKRDRGEARNQARDLLARVQLSGLEKRKPHLLSGGERQRVAIARALARSPRVLLLDEPFSAIDRMTRVKLRSDLLALKSALSIPIVLVTHDIDEALQLADRVTILDHGRTLQSGSAESVRATPASPRVAAILGL